MPKYYYILLLIGLCTPRCSHSQHLPGAAMDNYAGTQALYHNPAFVADSRYAVHANLVGTQFYTANNHVRYAAPYSFLNLITGTVPDEYKTDRGSILFPRSYLKENLNGNKKYLNAGGDIRLPSLMVGLYKGKIGVGVTTRLRYMLNASGITEPMARLISQTTKFEEDQGHIYENQSGNLHVNGFGEIAFTVGGVLLDSETDFIKVGITVKRLVGLYNAHAEISDSKFSVLPDPSWNNLRELIGVNELHANYALTKDEAISDFKPSPSWLLGNSSPGGGWGVDVGMVYEYRPDINKYSYTEKGERKHDASKNKYLYRISLALTDIGKIHYKNPYYILQQSTDTYNTQFRYNDFQKPGGSEGIFNAINTALNEGTPMAPNFKSVLPMAFQGSIDYQLRPNVYVNGLWVQNLVGQGAFGMKAESILAFTPRYEHKWFQLSVPITLMNRYRSPTFGLAGRVGPLWVGTDHLTGLVNIGDPRAFNIYMGLSAGLFRKPPKAQNQCWPPRESFFKRMFNRN
ncbi:hypothetical protein CLV98_11858 [Dyadobacter jejuensis]|uniref:DUF5723 domain-containing protein n=1 Tax=Dyadobacter jejuensis TaxID=1082580 RepID=A0A316A8P5_9BACT|nr:DUF5723 family protein [Dyadobacter jejuensis]PWJ54296.1 hypothetical protein CLV98_11858 [Dyadobacter jejuensis]